MALLAKAGRYLGAAAERMQGCGGHAPRLARRAIAARQRQGREAGDPPHRGTVHVQQFAAPSPAVRAKPGAIKGHPQHRPFMLMLRQDRGDVRVMVLYADQRHTVFPGKAHRQLRRQHIRV